MNLALDIGNSAVKWATFEGRNLISSGLGMPMELVEGADAVMACASGSSEGVPEKVEYLSMHTVLPIKIDYKTPLTLGPDRVAAACGCRSLFGSQNCLIIDAGTCITVDFIDARGTYHGGAIMPGIDMQLAALHDHTSRLPLVLPSNSGAVPVIGRSTEECILAGTLGATMLALAGFVACYKPKCPDLRIVVTGGDAELLCRAHDNDWQVEPHLTLIGLNEIMLER